MIFFWNKTNQFDSIEKKKKDDMTFLTFKKRCSTNLCFADVYRQSQAMSSTALRIVLCQSAENFYMLALVNIQSLYFTMTYQDM